MGHEQPLSTKLFKNADRRQNHPKQTSLSNFDCKIIHDKFSEDWSPCIRIRFLLRRRCSTRPFSISNTPNIIRRISTEIAQNIKYIKNYHETRAMCNHFRQSYSKMQVADIIILNEYLWVISIVQIPFGNFDRKLLKS